MKIAIFDQYLALSRNSSIMSIVTMEEEYRNSYSVHRMVAFI